MTPRDLDDIRQSVLDRMERSDRHVKWAVLGAAAVEAVIMVGILLVIDWGDRLHRLLFLLFALGYMVMVLGFAALAAHVSRTAGRVLAALDRDGGP